MSDNNLKTPPISHSDSEVSISDLKEEDNRAAEIVGSKRRGGQFQFNALAPEESLRLKGLYSSYLQGQLQVNADTMAAIIGGKLQTQDGSITTGAKATSSLSNAIPFVGPFLSVMADLAGALSKNYERSQDKKDAENFREFSPSIGSGDAWNDFKKDLARELANKRAPQRKEDAKELAIEDGKKILEILRTRDLPTLGDPHFDGGKSVREAVEAATKVTLDPDDKTVPFKASAKLEKSNTHQASTEAEKTSFTRDVELAAQEFSKKPNTIMKILGLAKQVMSGRSVIGGKLETNSQERQ